MPTEYHYKSYYCLYKFASSSELSEFFDKIPVRILFNVLFCVFRFPRASSNALSTSFIEF